MKLMDIEKNSSGITIGMRITTSEMVKIIGIMGGFLKDRDGMPKEKRVYTDLLATFNAAMKEIDYQEENSLFKRFHVEIEKPQVISQPLPVPNVPPPHWEMP